MAFSQQKNKGDNHTLSKTERIGIYEKCENPKKM
jgi:hypothetical protein